MLALTSIDPRQLVEVGNLARDLHRKIAHIEARNPLHPTLPRKNRPAKLFLPDPIRTNNANSRDHRTLVHVWSSGFDSMRSLWIKAGLRDKRDRVIGPSDNRVKWN